jgi:glycosyltransferase involved in cell wall biosynthesis
MERHKLPPITYCPMPLGLHSELASQLCCPVKEQAGAGEGSASGLPEKRVLLVSNRVMHYRVSVYNYFWRRFREHGWNYSVITNELQKQNRIPPHFELTETPFSFWQYRRHIRRLQPDVVILFLHFRDRIIWPLLHWLKLARIPVASWTKTRNLDNPDNPVRNAAFNYVHHMCDALILYTDNLMEFLPERERHKVFVANNTINFEDFPEIPESKEEIRQSLGIPFRKIVLFVGRIGEEKNRKKVDHLIDMFRDLKREELGLVIVGSGLPEELRARMNPRNTIYLGEIHDPQNLRISRIFKMADISSIPGHVGLGLNQAFYWGLPVVTEAGLQPPEICYLEHGRNGFIVPKDDTSALRERILYLADNDEVRAEFSANARADILKRASTEGMFQGFLKCAEYASRKNRRSLVQQ